MKFYSRYITTNFLTMFFSNIVKISSIIAIIQSLKLLNLFANYDVNIINFFHIFLLLYPSIFFFLIPISIYISGIQVFYNLYKNSELSVLFSAGISKLKLTTSLLPSIIFIITLHYILSLYYLPKANYLFREKIELNKNIKSSLNFNNNFSIPISGISIYSEKQNDEYYKNIFIEDTRQKPIITTYTANSALFSSDKSKLILLKGRRQDINKVNHNVNTLVFEEFEIFLESFFANSKHQDNISKSISGMSINELLVNRDSKYKDSKSKQMLSEANIRILWPLITPLLFLLGASAILRGEYSRVGKKKNIILYSVKLISCVITVLALNEFTYISKLIILTQYFIIIFSTWFYFKELKKLF